MTLVEEWADGVRLRSTRTDYSPNVAAHIVNLPSRVRVYDGNGACVSETRTIYDRWGAASDLRWPPILGRVSEVEKALVGCSDVFTVAANDLAWQIERFGYDAYGNRTIRHQVAGSNDGSVDHWTNTAYDGVYHLFPVRVYDGVRTEFAETASYYGVNATSGSEMKGWDDPWAYWGAMAEWCDVNEVCVRQGYDGHGRRTLRWENVGKGTLWQANTEANAAVQWSYRDPLNNVGWDDVTVTEWRNPRCEGNFVRKHYNGFGQLVQEQRPDQGWSLPYENCGSTVSPLPEVDVDYLYDGLGRRYAASVPHPATANWVGRPANWNYGASLTSYDALGRVTQTTAPNGEVTVYTYSGRQTKVTGVGRNGYPNKVLQWTETDALGRLAIVHAGGSEATKVTLTYDTLGNLTRVAQPGVTGGISTTLLTYDFGGRKVAMSDPDLGTWSYGYNRQGQLTRQTDGRGWTTCLYYDNLGRLGSQYFQSNILCSGPSGVGRRTVYTYSSVSDANSRSCGQLVNVAKYDDAGALYYSRSRSYDSLGRLAAQGVRAGASGVWTTSYSYDGFSRLWATVYPDGEQVMVGYGAMGLPVKLVSSYGYDLVDGGVTDGIHTDAAAYDTAGQLEQVRYPAGGNLWRTELRYGWQSSDGNGNRRLGQLLIGTAAGAGDRYQANQGYDSYGNIMWRSEFVGASRQADYSFQYDDQNRIDRGWYGRYAPGDVLTYAQSVDYTYDPQGGWPDMFETGDFDLLHGHFSGPLSHGYLFDSNGNVRWRAGQTLNWDAENHLAQVTSGGVSESYLYDESGGRVVKAAGSTSTYYLFPHYERKVSVGVATVTKYYFFGNMLIAKRENNVLTYLHSDSLGSVILETNTAGNVVNDQRYYAYGRRFDTGGDISGERDFTGQKLDATGLVYMNARYYDPTLGQFISPDTIVPEPSSFLSYNRYLYGYGNPVKYNDPSGHYSVDELQQHFGVSSFDELMALFEEGGVYEGLEGWYDILRFAQDGDTIVAMNDLIPPSLTGTFVRDEQGKIWIDMGTQGLIPEFIFAHFGGIVRNSEGQMSSLGTYVLRGQTPHVARSVAGGQRYIDMRSCANFDCIAIAIDGVGVAGSGLQLVSAVCGPYAGACYNGGRLVSGVATVTGWGYTAINAWQGNATGADLAATTVTAATGLATEDPKVSLGAGIAQFIWDTFISPLQR